jgi:uncharacterized protein (PEP-CTERM system associated)
MLAAATAAVATAVPVANAQTVRITPTIAWETTLTDNVDLSTQRRSDWVNQFTPGVAFQAAGAHSRLSGTLSAPMVLYARTSENNQVFPQAAVNGSWEALDRFLFVDAFANVSQQYESPFGARSTSLANATQNRYTAQAYGVTPSIRGEMPGGIAYDLRDNNTWSDANASSIGNGRSYTNEIVGRLGRAPAPGGWALEYDRSDVRFSEESQSELIELARARARWRMDPAFEVSASAGYEDNRFFLTRENGAIYGLGMIWRPNDRTNLNATWEHRFFGASYDVSFNHSTRLTVWSLAASRNITSYPQQLATLGAGANVAALLNSLFAQRIADPLQRQGFVDQLIRDRGLPAVLTGPIPLLAQQVTLVEQVTASAGILGARNSILFSLYRSRSEPIEGGALSPLVSEAIDNTQLGTSVAWTHQLSPTLTFGTNLDWSRTTANSQGGGTTRLYALRAYLSTPLSPWTSLSAGVRFQDSRSDVADSYREAAIFLGLAYQFH